MSSLLKQASLFCDDGLDNLDLAAVVVTALLAHSVRQVQRTAFGASNETGSLQLPNGAAALVASCFGYFSLRYCHCDTSLIFQRPGTVPVLIFTLFLQKLGQDRQPGIGLLFTGAGAEVQIGAAPGAESLAIF